MSPSSAPHSPSSVQSHGSNIKKPIADPMEEFLAKEKAALDALENVGIVSGGSTIPSPNDMQIDSFEGATEQPTSGISSVHTTHSHSSQQQPAHQSPSSSHHVPAYANNSPVSQFSPQRAASIHSPQTTTSPTSPTLNRGNARPETEAMKEWKAERTRKIAEREVIAEQEHRNRLEQAKKETSDYMAKWKGEVDDRKAANRRNTSDASDVIGQTVWDKETPNQLATVRKDNVDWKGLTELVEQLPKPTKDSTRLLSTLRSVANQ